MENTNEIQVQRIGDLKIKHEQTKIEMLSIVDASRILQEQYNLLETELYKIEDEYVSIMKEITK